MGGTDAMDDGTWRLAGWRCLAIGTELASTPPRTLLLHGFTGAAADWDGLGLRRPALALDLPGHGGSRVPDDTAADCFDAGLRQLLAALPVSIDRLAGYSLGGRIALGLLRLAPQRFAAATILSAHPGLTDAGERAARRAADRRWIELLRRDGIQPFVDAWETLPLFASQARMPPGRLAAQRQQRLAQSAEGLARSLACHGLGAMPPAWDALAAWPGRLHWVCGAADTRFTAIARCVAEQRPATTLTLLPGIGHNPLIEAPARVAALIDADVETPPAAASPG
jgi:2-succinyl-6-hydroxy-2,4-cyclohexadiene-1-carboxylate synthase